MCTIDAGPPENTPKGEWIAQVHNSTSGRVGTAVFLNGSTDSIAMSLDI